MKIAFLFYGQLRWYELANDLFKANFQPALSGHQVQYFAHFWNDQYLNELKEIYQPLIYKIEPQIEISEIKRKFNNNINKVSDNLPSQLYSLHQSFLLLKEFQESNNTSFDLYIKIRTDLAFLNQIDVNKFNSRAVYLAPSNGRNLADYAQDLVLFTHDYNNIKKVAEMGFHLDSILSNLSRKENRSLFYHEEILAEYFKMNKIESKPHNFNVDLARHRV